MIVNTNFTTKIFALCLFIAGAICGCSYTKPTEYNPIITYGKNSFIFDNGSGPKIKTWTYVPREYTKDTQVVFVMHGTKRDGERYRDEWIGLAEQYQFLLVVPEFSKADFPKANGYNLGNVFNREHGSINKKEKWSYSTIEPIFDLVKKRFNNASSGYALYGHSAGAQFVHRFIYFVPQARITAAVSANAGWYTLPSYNQAFPYGLENTPVNASQLSQALSRKLVVLLGTKDTDPQHRYLRVTPEAMAQGNHRFARGHHFYHRAEKRAKKQGIAFNWQLEYAPQVGHKNRLMAQFAAEIITNNKHQKTIEDELDILFLGDTSHGENYLEQYEKKGEVNILKQHGYDYSMANFLPLMKSSDYVIANLETPLTTIRTPPYPAKAYNHWSDPIKASQSLAHHNISAVSLANNHTLDFAMPALNETFEALKSKNIEYFGAGKNQKAADAPLIETFNIQGCTIDLAVYGRFEYRASYAKNYDFYAEADKGGASALRLKKLSEDIAKLRQQRPNIYIVVYPHWGKNYKWHTPEQTEIARKLVAAGADLILGHGAHTAGAIENIGGSTVVYSIGNFVFNSGGRFDRYPEVLPMSLIAKLSGRKINDQVAFNLHMYPIYSNNRKTDFQPRFVNQEEYHFAVQEILERSNGISKVNGNYDGFGSRLSLPVKPASCRKQALTYF